MRKLVAVMALAGVLSLTFTGSAGASAAVERGQRIDMIRISGFTFYPNNPRVSPGQVVQVKNLDWAMFMEPHTLTARDGSFDTGPVLGDIETFTAPTDPGRYRFYCVVHPPMRGLLIVLP